MKRPFIIAEMSANHLGSFHRAADIVRAAAKAGANAIKLQTWSPGTMAGPKDFVLPSGPWTGRRLADLYAEAFTPWEWHAPLFGLARSLGMEGFSSAFDVDALDFLEGLGAPRYKISSFEIIDLRLIKAAAATGKPLILSCGMASHYEISTASACARAAGCKDLTLLKCTSAYPSRPDDANLATMNDMRQFDCDVGLSDHSPGWTVAAAAAANGASVIEKHLTLRRADGGPDAGFSMEPEEFAEMVAACRAAAETIGQVRYGASYSEASQEGLRRSLYLALDVKAGTRLESRHVRSARPALGLHPHELDRACGMTLVRDVAANEPLSWDMLA